MKGKASGGDGGFENLLQRLVDVAHHRHAVEDAVPEADDGAAEKVGRQRAEHHEAENGDDQPEARYRHRQIIVGVGGRRQQGLHQAIDPADEPPDHPQGDGDRGRYDETGEEVGPEPGKGCQAKGQRRFHRHVQLRIRHVPRLVDGRNPILPAWAYNRACSAKVESPSDLGLA